MRSLALTVLLAGCVQPVPDSGARDTLTHYLAEIRPEDRTMTTTKVETADTEMVAALREFVSYGLCRQGNTAERKALAEYFAVLAHRYNPILERRGVSPSQMSDVEFSEATK